MNSPICLSLKVDEKHTIRHTLRESEIEAGTPITISSFHTPEYVENCTLSNAQLIIFKETGSSQFHPKWIIDCESCPYWNPEIERVRRAYCLRHQYKQIHKKLKQIYHMP